MIIDEDQHRLDTTNITAGAKWQRKYQAKNGDEIREKRWREQFAYYNQDGLIGVDGEGVTLPDKTHIYTLLGASDGTFVYKPTGLHTKTCFDFLLTFAGKRVVGFAFTYDANMILGNLQPQHLKRLHEQGFCYWADYMIEWTPRRMLRIHKRSHDWKETLASVTVWDTFGFYQSSFVSTLRSWSVGTKEEQDEIAEMKQKRGDFSEEQKDEIAAYNLSECRLLVELQRKLQTTLEGARIRPSRWDGSGAVAAAILKRSRVREHMNDDYPKEVMGAYYGGRIQTLMIGHVPGPIYNYDINSAYPSAMRNLPCLQGKWRFTNKYEQTPYAIWRCRWHLGPPARLTKTGQRRYPINEDVNVTPFPFRKPDKHICYPTEGRGWYWSVLVEEVMKHWEIDVECGFVFEPDDPECRPFAFVEELYLQRQEYKRTGDPRHIVIKLGLNSLYGKTAQGLAFRGTNPPYRNYVWAGIITATTQASLIRTAMGRPDSIINFATDGIYSRERLPVNIGNGLGEWEESTYDDATIFQPGLARLSKNGKTWLRTRGYFPDEVNWDELIALWKRSESFARVKFNVERFLTLGVAIQTHNYKNWRRWATVPREMALRPASGSQGSYLGTDLVRWMPDLYVEDCSCSVAFTPRKSRYDDEQQLRDAIVLEQPVPIL